MRSLILPFVLFSMITTALQATTIFSDLTSFQTATTGLSVDSFEDDPRFVLSDPIIRDDFTIQESGDAQNQIGVGSPAFTGIGVVSGTGSAIYNDGSSSLLNFTDFTAGTTAFGFWITHDFEPTFVPTDITVTVTGSVSTSFVVRSDQTAVFFGVTEEMGISNLSFDVGSEGLPIEFDDVYTGQASATVVPLPAAGLMLLAGFGGLAMVRSKRNGSVT